MTPCHLAKSSFAASGFVIMVEVWLVCYLFVSVTKLPKKMQPCKKTNARIWYPSQMRALKKQNAVIIQFGDDSRRSFFTWQLFSLLQVFGGAALKQTAFNPALSFPTFGASTMAHRRIVAFVAQDVTV